MHPLFYHSEITDSFSLSPEEAGHAVRVLRLQSGDKILVTDGKGTQAEVVISLHGKECTCEVVQKNSIPKKIPFVHLAVGMLKHADRMEWMVEKCVEMGVGQLTLLKTKHAERTNVNLARLHKIALAAMKQSQQSWLPSIRVTDWKTILKGDEKNKFIALQQAKHSLKKQLYLPSSLVLIGPEGDFSADEIADAEQHQFMPVHLESSRLRTETACLKAVAVML